MSFSFASKISRLVLSHDGNDDDNSETLISSSSSLFSSLVNSTIVSPQDNPIATHSPQPSPPGTTRQSFSSPFPLSPISIPRPPILSSTPMASQPDTQQLALRMVDLRSVDEIDAVALKRENVRLQRENESLQSEVTALRLQHDDEAREISRLRLLLSPPPSSPTEQQQQQQPPSATNEYRPFMTKSKRKRLKKKAHIERALLAPADTTRPPGCTTLPLPPPPPSQTRSSLPTLFVFHDSNLKGTSAAELNKAIASINKNNNNNNNFNVSLHETFTLSQTLDEIRRTTFKRNDTVLICTLTNDARQTNKRQRRTPDQTKNIQTQIIKHLITHIPSKSIILLEAPPLLDSASSDIYPYNLNSYSLSRQFQCGFARILVGENHLWSDGYHILHKDRHLLLKSIAAAAARVSVHEHHKLLHPPFGTFGPWAAPKGQGIIPFSKMALKQPINFRRASPIQPLMGLNIHRYN